MLSCCRHFYSCLVVIGVLVNADRSRAVEPVGQFGTTSETAMADSSAGAEAGHSFKLTFEQADSGTIKRPPGEWFLVAAAVDSKDGYVPEIVAKLVENSPSPLPAAPAGPVIAKTEKAPSGAAGAAPAQVTGAEPVDGKSPSILQLLEVHEKEVKVALVVAGGAFVLGWICGGMYSVRRERKYRRRLRL